MPNGRFARPLRLYLVRHAEAAPGEPDDLRPLTPAGRETARALGARLAADGVQADAVLSSPLLRARETAAELGRALRCEPEADERLAPGSTVDELRDVVAGRGADGRGRRPPAGLRRDRGGADRRAAAGVPARRPRGARTVTAEAAAISVTGLQKSYGAYEAVRGIDFEIETGEVFGLLGPNGAGKTTTVEILEGYRPRDGGQVSVLGQDPAHAGPDWRQRIGVVLQSGALYPNLTVTEHLELFAGYYERPRDVGQVIEVVGLADKHDARVRTLSGGQQRRLDLGLGLIGDPEVLFLDEPTTGFDPAARRAAWEVIRSLRRLGKTILLTTHYLDEAEQLADRVAVLREGAIVAIGRPEELSGAAPATEIRYRRNGEEILVSTHEPTRVLHELTAEALAQGHELEGLSVRRPTLEEVYLALTEETQE